MLDGEIVAHDGEIQHGAELGAAASLDFETGEGEIERQDVANLDDVGAGNEFVGGVDDEAERGVFANGGGGESVV